MLQDHLYKNKTKTKTKIESPKLSYYGDYFGQIKALSSCIYLISYFGQWSISQLVELFHLHLCGTSNEYLCKTPSPVIFPSHFSFRHSLESWLHKVFPQILSTILWSPNFVLYHKTIAMQWDKDGEMYMNNGWEHHNHYNYESGLDIRVTTNVV